MDSAEARRLVQLALSYRQQVQDASRDCSREYTAGVIDRPKYEQRLANFSNHRAQAESEIVRLRDLVQLESAAIARALREALDEYERLHASVKAGRTTEQKARQTLKRLKPRIDLSRKQIAELNTLHAARSAKAAGAFIALSVEDYMPAIVKTASSIRPAKARRMPAWRNWTPFIGVLASACIALVLLWPFGSIGGEAQFKARMAESDPNVVLLSCTNRRKTPITFHVPWGAWHATASKDTNIASHYGVSVYVRERSNGIWRLLDEAGAFWRHNGRPVAGDGAFTIDPGFPLNIELDTRLLARHTFVPHGLKLEFSQGGGRVLATFSAEPLPAAMR